MKVFLVSVLIPGAARTAVDSLEILVRGLGALFVSPAPSMSLGSPLGGRH